MPKILAKNNKVRSLFLFRVEVDFSKPELLIIEDHADVVTYLRLCLSDLFNITVRKNGEEGISYAKETVPDIIISDVLMPVKDGFAVCRELKHNAATSHVPIILLSARTDTGDSIRGTKIPATSQATGKKSPGKTSSSRACEM